MPEPSESEKDKMPSGLEKLKTEAREFLDASWEDHKQ